MAACARIEALEHLKSVLREASEGTGPEGWCLLEQCVGPLCRSGCCTGIALCKPRATGRQDVA